MPFAGLQLHHGLRGGCAAPEPEAVTGATPLPGRLACHGGGLGCARHPNPPREVAPGQQSLAGRPSDARDERVPSLRGDAERPDDQAVGQQVRRLLEAALGTLPVRTADWERPRSGGEDGAVRLYPPRCRLKYAEMGGRSQPRPRSADRHRRSAGRATTASGPATSTAGAVSGRTAISCPATPKANRTRRTSHLHPHPAVITGRGGEGLDPGGRNGRSPCRRPGGPAAKRWQRRRHCSPVTPRTQPQSRRASTGGDRPSPERDFNGGSKGGGAPLASLRRGLTECGPKE